MKNTLFVILFLFTTSLYADCIWGAKDKDTYRVIDTGYGAKILFSGGYTNDFIIKIDGSIYSKDLEEVYFIKDDFCDWESDVIVIDGYCGFIDVSCCSHLCIYNGLVLIKYAIV